ncbi:hypothetical protein KBC55_02860 [Patescibacteria group bacterium]|nr:hypothetical protein [Patescibacteria group bacterium]
MFLFETDHVRDLHFTEGGNVVGDANGFTADDYPTENLYEAAEWVAPKYWINVDDLAASPADVDDSDEYDTDFDFTKDEAGEPVLAFRHATRRMVVVTFETSSFIWPSQDDEPTNSEIAASPAEVNNDDTELDEAIPADEQDVEIEDDELPHPEQSAVTRKVMEGREGERRLLKASHKHDGKGEKLHKSRIALRRHGKTLRHQLNELAAQAIPAEVVMRPVLHWTEAELAQILVVESDLEAEAWNAELEYLEWWHNHCYDYAEPEPTARERYEAQLREERQAWEDKMSAYGDELMRYEATHGHLPWEADEHWTELELALDMRLDDDIVLPEAQCSGICVRATMSADEYSYYTLFKSSERSKDSGRGWKRNKPLSARERKQLVRSAA